MLLPSINAVFKHTAKAVDARQMALIAAEVMEYRKHTANFRKISLFSPRYRWQNWITNLLCMRKHEKVSGFSATPIKAKSPMKKICNILIGCLCRNKRHFLWKN